MKKSIIFITALILMGCANVQKIQHFEISEYFLLGKLEYSGGFEGAGSKVTSKRVVVDKKEFIVEDTQDTAARVQRVYLINENSVDLIFTGEETQADLENLNISDGEKVLKTPLTVGNKWESKGNRYKIIKADSAKGASEITVEKIYPHGMVETTTYKKGIGKIARKVKM